MLAHRGQKIILAGSSKAELTASSDEGGEDLGRQTRAQHDGCEGSQSKDKRRMMSIRNKQT